MRRIGSFVVLGLFAGCAAAPNSTGSGEGPNRRGGAAGNATDGGAGGQVQAGGKAMGAGRGAASGAAGEGSPGGGASGASGAPVAGNAGESATGGGPDKAGSSGMSGGQSGKSGASGGKDGGAAGKGGGAAGQAGAGGGPSCSNVVCALPPPKHCVSPTELEVFSALGTCSGGGCSYTATKAICAKGCANDACIDDPCFGVSCNSPPAAKCAAPDKLRVGDVPGTCTAGSCAYTTKEVFCSFGCENDVCKGDPCAGKSCATPPASFCSAADKLTVAAAQGTCDPVTAGCDYAPREEHCAFGCVAGACKGDPCVGVSCSTPPAAYCFDANTRRVASPAGSCAAGACTYGSTDQPCVRGCAAGVCRECVGDSDCAGSNELCDAGTCKVCATDLRCGGGCAPCAGPAPVCKSNGATSSCVACTSAAQCTGGKICGPANTCIADGCPPPADACSDGTQSRDKCTGARVIGRKNAAAGVSIKSDTCSASDRSNQGGQACFDAGGDHHYRVYLRTGETVEGTIVEGQGCVNGSWDSTLKMWTTTTCNGSTPAPFADCGTRVVCQDYAGGKKGSFTATGDGWVVLVVDGSTAFDDEGDYTFNVKLTCKVPGCECP